MKKFLKKILFYSAIIALYFAVTGAYNYTYDPYGIIGNRTKFEGIRPNEHSLKVNHVLQNPETFNSFLFSNSKGGTLHFNQLNTPHEKWYNMTYSLGTPEEFYADILLFLEGDVTIKKIVLALDDGAIYERASAHENQASRKFVSLKENKMNWEYLFLPISFKKIWGVDLSKKHIEHDIFDNGNYYAKNAYHLDCDRTEPLKLIANPKEQSKAVVNFSAKLKILKDIQRLCNEKNIDLTFLEHPTSYENYQKATERLLQFSKLMTALKQEDVRVLQPFEQNLVQNNPCYWLDRHHYTKKVGDSIVQLYAGIKK